MRVAFFEPTEPTLTSNRKGHLFEQLARRLVEASGYRDVVLRQKHNSLEYDVEGRHSLNSTKLVGEAKALDRNIDGQTLSAFVGKLLPLAASERIDGLFVSISPFTADAEDYLRSLTEATSTLNLSLTTLVGDQIPTFLRERLGHVSEDAIRERVKQSLDLDAMDVWLVVTERDEFFVASCGPNTIETPTSFVVLRTDGSQLDLGEEIVERLQAQLPDLTGLALAQESAQPTLPPRAERLAAVDPGAGWFDYRFPAPPECFIGRLSAVEEITRTVADVIRGDTALRTIQILSRSGVGKSSLLLKLGAEMPGTAVVTIDARSLRVPSEVRLVVGALVEKARAAGIADIDPPRTQDEAAAALEAVGEALAGRAGVIELDQFESTLALPTVFAAVLDLIAATTSRSLPIVWVLARKNDLSTTFDESAGVDVERLNNQSKAIALDDFSPPESSALLDRLGEELGQSLRPALAAAILTFSAGFPWLLKRLCAHVLSMRDEGVSQEELLQQGLRAEDLFEEDMAGLSEADKALLRRLANYLPSTGAELARDLESEISAARLREKLNEFLGKKLLRLTGDVFDTYNDVFKTYLVTDSVPFKSRYIFRVYPKPALDLLPLIAETGPVSSPAFARYVGGSSRIALLNKLRELRLLGLISPERNRVAITPEAQAALEGGTLGELLRARLRGNALVLRVLDLLSARDAVTLDTIADELREQLPHLEVADTTWKLYARTLAVWLDFSGLGYIEGESLRLSDMPPDDSLRGREFYAARFVPNTFMPSVRPRMVVELVEALRGGVLERATVYSQWGSQYAPGILRDARALDLVEEIDGEVRPAAQARILFQRARQVSELDVAQLALTKPNVKALLAATAEGAVDPTAEREIVSTFGAANWSEGTWKWRLGILNAWLTATGEITVRRGAGLTRTNSS